MREGSEATHGGRSPDRAPPHSRREARVGKEDSRDWGRVPASWGLVLRLRAVRLGRPLGRGG